LDQDRTARERKRRKGRESLTGARVPAICGQGMGIPSIAVLLGEGEDMNAEQCNKVGTVGRLGRSRSIT
jgi:uridine phosphorylase